MKEYQYMKCGKCGHIFKSNIKTKRVQCSVCKSTRITIVDETTELKDSSSEHIKKVQPDNPEKLIKSTLLFDAPEPTTTFEQFRAINGL